MQMSAEWNAEMDSLIRRVRRPSGRCLAVDACLEWVLMGTGDARVSTLLNAGDDADGARTIARALRAGGWSGGGIEDLIAMLRERIDDAPERPLVEAFVRRYDAMRARQNG